MDMHAPQKFALVQSSGGTCKRQDTCLRSIDLCVLKRCSGHFIIGAVRITDKYTCMLRVTTCLDALDALDALDVLDFSSPKLSGCFEPIRTYLFQYMYPEYIQN